MLVKDQKLIYYIKNLSILIKKFLIFKLKKIIDFNQKSTSSFYHNSILTLKSKSDCNPRSEFGRLNCLRLVESKQILFESL